MEKSKGIRFSEQGKQIIDEARKNDTPKNNQPVEEPERIMATLGDLPKKEFTWNGKPKPVQTPEEKNRLGSKEWVEGSRLQDDISER